MLTIDTERDGEVGALPGVMAYGATEAEARQKATALVLRAIADRAEHGEPVPEEARAFKEIGPRMLAGISKSPDCSQKIGRLLVTG